ncbi:MAG: YhbY family RNA-binding protein [Oscillospiraceae bacterium]
MITTKQRATLRGFANKLEVILQIGKGGITSTVLKQANDALVAREMIKCKVLDNSGIDVREAAQKLAEAAQADIVQTIGSRFVIYKKNEKTPIYEI